MTIVTRRWEYTTMEDLPAFRGPDKLVERLNNQGKMGWELVGVVNGRYVFKREVRQYDDSDYRGPG